MPAVPLFLRASTSNQRENFGQLNAIENRRITGSLDAETISDGPNLDLWAITDAIIPVNVKRNRYSNVFPWNKNRVQLPVKPGASDYINASYVTVQDIDGNQDNYIACQGPLETTAHHFWTMAFNESEKQQNDTIIIVMVTPLIESNMIKCSKYWPDSSHPVIDYSGLVRKDGIDLPKLTVSYVAEEYNTEGDYLLTNFELSVGNKVKQVYHYYYYKWADAKVPPSIAPLIKLSQDVRTTVGAAGGASNPVPIVHCSAGVGRTGTFIAIDHLFHDLEHLATSSGKRKEYDISQDPILHTVAQLRSNRMMMVQTVYQYNFLYDAARELLDQVKP
ncbi:receptor/non-receptor type protein-tyrosine phosphatase [Suhomyces tanzawaensis NRRL Y-17324]|uniref:Receptor/non-receptor type protein-tyrosine phosphatase n=1 Tax=Suhomyces tanzawaensis NRRL Y-17324 TaxID=984487 RepID=A0A1E4SL98_9ASCO|nr:receptor/non-receptor type protein-tyrosine phosphatase [Suhomyces tanzawaensis NRRL Y-17324]ODV80276.1 receptor/non-receptor type protein-tyrosine phosphatase [Suhomyces tanzawaensis NRRL Y-17324]